MSYCPELDVASCGHTQDEALKNLAEVIKIQEIEMKRLGTLQDLADHSTITDDKNNLTGTKQELFS